MIDIERELSILESDSSSDKEKDIAIDKVYYANDKRLIPKMMELLSSDSLRTGTRDLIAMSLGFAGASEAAPKIVELIKRPSNYNRRSGLVYAMTYLDCREYYLDFVDVFCYGNTICKLSASTILRDNLNKIDIDTIFLAINLLKQGMKDFAGTAHRNDRYFKYGVRRYIRTFKRTIAYKKGRLKRKQNLAHYRPWP